MDTNIEKMIWKSRANDLLDTMSAYGMMLDKINRHTHDVITTALVDKKHNKVINISQYDIELPDGTKVKEVSLNADGEISINGTELFLRHLEPYDKIKIAQGVTSKVIEFFS
jgi:hypothetical protein